MPLAQAAISKGAVGVVLGCPGIESPPNAGGFLLRAVQGRVWRPNRPRTPCAQYPRDIKKARRAQ